MAPRQRHDDAAILRPHVAAHTCGNPKSSGAFQTLDSNSTSRVSLSWIPIDSAHTVTHDLGIAHQEAVGPDLVRDTTHRL